MIRASIAERLSFNARRSLATMRLDDHLFIGAVGFEGELRIEELEELELDASHLTVILSEMRTRPRATVAEVRDVVEGFDRNSDPDYNGHDAAAIAVLYPPVRVFRAVAPPASAWSTFFKLCLDEGDYIGMWSDAGLSEALRGISDQDPERIPYRILCRSMFDGDPTTLFLALYRSLEQIYSYSGARDLMRFLSINEDWNTVAAALEDCLGWYPKEEGSLVGLLRLADPDDLRAFLIALNEETPDHDQLAQQAAKRVYRLRNAIVHFRPYHSSVDLDAYDWEALSKPMARVVVNVYARIFNAAEAAEDAGRQPGRGLAAARGDGAGGFPVA
jgi:hypothetical protein